MSRTLFAFVLALATLSTTARAQDHWRFEIRSGAVFPTQELAQISLDPGFGFEATAGYRILPHLSAYAGWGWHHFSAEPSFLGSETDVEETGYALGLRFEHPIGAPGSPMLRLRAGGTYSHIEIEDQAGDLLVDSGHGLGWEAGAGLAVLLGHRWELAPGVRFRSLSRDLPIGSATTSGTLSYVAVDLGISRSF